MTIALRYPRLFVDDDGITHWEDCTLEMPTRDFAPPTTPLEASALMPAEGFVVLLFAPDWEGPWHPSPYRQWFFMLSGSLTVSVSDGTERTLSGGDFLLLDDEGSVGHLTRVNGNQQATCVGVRVADG